MYWPRSCRIFNVHRVRELGGGRRLPCCVPGDRSGAYVLSALAFIVLNASPVDCSLPDIEGHNDDDADESLPMSTQATTLSGTVLGAHQRQVVSRGIFVEA